MSIDIDMANIRLTVWEKRGCPGPDQLSSIDPIAAWAASGTLPVVPVTPDPAPASLSRKLGRKPAKRDPRVPKLVHVAPGLPPAPDTYNAYNGAVSSWVMAGNDKVGDCTCAEIANTIDALTSLAGTPRIIPDADVVAFYSSVSGYDPSNPDSDQGAMIEDVLAAWHTRGIDGDKVDGYATIDPSNHDRIKQAVAFLAPVSIGINLPNGWMQATTWDVSTAGEGIAGGHCVAVVGYDANGPIIVSWAQVFRMTWAAWDAYVDEAHAVLSEDAIEKSGRDAGNVDWETLTTWMEALHGNA